MSYNYIAEYVFLEFVLLTKTTLICLLIHYVPRIILISDGMFNEFSIFLIILMNNTIYVLLKSQ